MEPVTHFLTGACLARAGCNRKAAYATLAMTLAAEMPDLDVVWAFRGPVANLQHHRGWTHTLVGVPLEAAVLVGVVWGLHRWRVRRHMREKRNTGVSPLRREVLPPSVEMTDFLVGGRKPGANLPLVTKAPVRWGWLFGMCVVALLSHLLLDWTNNYGVRPFFPFDPRWIAGSFVFIFEPAIFLLLGVSLVAPALFGLIGSEVGVRREVFRGRGWAVFGLCGVLVVWGVRAYEHGRAMELARSGDYGPGETVSRVYASPEPINPFRWHVVADLPSAYQLGVADTLAGTLTATPDDLLYKPPTTLATLAAKQSWLGEVYLDWSRWALVTDIGPDGDGFTEVTFRDLRFMYDTVLLKGRQRSPLSGVVSVDEDRRIRVMELNGSEQK